MSRTEPQSQILKDIRGFVIAAKSEPEHIVNRIKENLPDKDKKDIDSQLKTFESDVTKVLKGEMSYSAMRSLYG